MTDDDALEGAVSREELDRLKARHPALGAAITRLQRTLEQALNRTAQPTPGKPGPVQSAVFFLGHQAADDFFDIVLLAAHGYGMGALKLLRPLFERVVTALYLMKHPGDVNHFNDYGDVHAHRFVHRAEQDGRDLSVIPKEQRAEIEDAYERVRVSFTDARGQVRGSWTKLKLDALAEKVGLAQLYSPCALWPTMQIHSTRVGLDARLRASEQGLAFTHEPQPEHADHALKYAHVLVVHLLQECNRFFAWGLDLNALVQDAHACWGDT